MVAIKESYRGPHKIILNKNARNLGIIPHIDQIVAMSSGEFIVPSGGDDISAPTRTDYLVRAWLDSGKKLSLLHSAVRTLKNGESVVRHPSPIVDDDMTPKKYVEKNAYVIGATQGWTRSLFDVFGPLGNALIDDRLLPFRALLLGGVGYIDEPLVTYRAGGVSQSSKPREGHEALYGTNLRYLRWYASSYNRYIEDMNRIDFPEKEICRRICKEKHENFQFAVTLADADFGRRASLLPLACKQALRGKNINPLRLWAQYTFEKIYINYWNKRYRKPIRQN